MTLTVTEFECRCAACGYGDWTADTQADTTPCPECGCETMVEAFPVYAEESP